MFNWFKKEKTHRIQSVTVTAEKINHKTGKVEKVENIYYYDSKDIEDRQLAKKRAMRKALVMKNYDPYAYDAAYRYQQIRYNGELVRR